MWEGLLFLHWAVQPHLTLYPHLSPELNSSLPRLTYAYYMLLMKDNRNEMRKNYSELSLIQCVAIKMDASQFLSKTNIVCIAKIKH